MAEFDTNSTPDNSFFPQDFSLEEITIETDAGSSFNVRSLMIELSFFEDIYCFVNSGYVILKDAVGIVEKLKLDGNEFITIKYGKNKKDVDKIQRVFRLYKVGNRTPIGNQNAEFLTLFFCTETLLLSEQIKISKGYTGKKIATSKDNTGIINNILVEKLKVNPKRIVEIEETYGLYDFVVPRLKPLEAISWLSTYARPAGNKKGADMLFFETNDGFMFKSLQSMLRSTPYATYKYQPKNLDFKNKLQEGIVTVLDFEIVKSFDTLEGTNQGVYANRLISVDPLTKNYKVTDFNYLDYLGTNVGGVIAPSTNKLNIKQTEAYESRLKVAMGNSNQTRVDYIKERQGSTAKDIFLETYIPNRTAQLALSNYTLVKMSIPGDTSLTVGKTINFNLYSLQMDDVRKLDDYYSGKYLVTAVRHVIQTNGKYQTFVEMAKESFNTNYTSPDSTSPKMKELQQNA